MSLASLVPMCHSASPTLDTVRSKASNRFFLQLKRSSWLPDDPTTLPHSTLCPAPRHYPLCSKVSKVPKSHK